MSAIRPEAVNEPGSPVSPGGRRPRALGRRRMNGVAAWLQIAPATAVVAVGFAVPMAFFVVYSFWQLRDYSIVADLTLRNYTGPLQDEGVRRLLRNTLVTSFATATLATTFALCMASLLRLRLRRWQNSILFLIMIALFSGYLVRIFAWRTFLGTSGVINTLLTGTGIVDHPISALLYTRSSTILVLVNFLIPLATLPCFAAMQNVADNQIEAARDLGASAITAYRRVVLPIAWPGVFAAFALTFIVASGDYLTPQLVGGTSGTMAGQQVADVFLNQFDWPGGAALAILNLLAVLISIGICRALLKRVVR